MTELKVLLFDLEIDIEKLDGVGKTEKIISLIQYMERRNDQMRRFLLKLVHERPDVKWFLNGPDPLI